MEFRILGPLEVVDGERNVPLGGSRQRALLALLLLSPNQVVSLERMADELWPEGPPDGVVHTLRVYMSRLRKALGSAGDEVVVTRAPGYVARIDRDELDAARFDALMATGRRQAASGRHAAAAVAFTESLGLWRGPALADVAGDFAFAQAAATRLEESRLDALEARIDADLACGRHHDVLTELESLTHSHPLRERLWAQRMVALYRAGRQADALRAYQDVRSLLRDELGIQPNSALRRLETAILRHDPELEPSPPPPPGAAAGTGLPLPVLLTDMGRVFVGREAELNRLWDLWGRATAEGATVALLAGEPGVGKTRLAGELASMVHAKGGVVSAGRCDEDLGVPYQPFVEALRHTVDHTPAARLGFLLGRSGGELARLVPELLNRVPDLVPPLQSDPETERYRLFDAIVGWLAAMSADRPVLLLLDDLQWAAKPTLLLLRHVSRAADLRRVLVLGVYRDTDLGRDHPLLEVLADLRRQTGTDRISLAGLDCSGVAAFMEEAAGHALAPGDLALADAIHQETEGNPFFVREVLRHLVETGSIERQRGRWRAQPLEGLGIPEGVREVVGRRLARLSDAAQRMLAAAAVIGPEFDFAVLGAVAGLDEEPLSAALEEAVGARLVLEAPGPRLHHRFAHSLVRATLYDGLPAHRRTRVHRQVGEAIEMIFGANLDAHAPALAHHFGRAAAAGDRDKAIAYTVRAGDGAKGQLAHDEAAAYYRQALVLLDDAAAAPEDGRRIDLMISLGDALRRAGDPSHRATLLEAARLAERWGDADRLTRAALANSRGMLFSSVGTVDDERRAMLETALRAVGPGDAAPRARLLANLGLELVFSPDDEPRRRLSDEALSLARQAGDDLTLADVLLARFYTIWAPSTLDERWRNVDELEQLAGDRRDPVRTALALLLGYRVAIESGDVARADRSLEGAERLAAELRQPTLQWMCLWLRGGRLLMAGSFDEAERASAEGARLGEALGQPDTSSFRLAFQFQAAYEQGRLAPLEDAMRETWAGLGLAVIDGLFALFCCELGRMSEARELLSGLVTPDSSSIPVDLYWLRATTDCAAVAARLGDSSRCGFLYGQLAPYAHQFVAHNAVGTTGSVSHYLGLLATAMQRFDEAERHFAVAVDAHRRVGAVNCLARSQREWVRMAGERAAARA